MGQTENYLHEVLALLVMLLPIVGYRLAAIPLLQRMRSRHEYLNFGLFFTAILLSGFLGNWAAAAIGLAGGLFWQALVALALWVALSVKPTKLARQLSRND